MRTMRLARISMRANFRQSAATLLRALGSKVTDELGPSDVVCFVSCMQNQVLFVWRESDLAWDDGEKVPADGAVRVVRSLRWHMPDGGGWHPLMLANYARAVGIKLEGIKLFEEHYRDLVKSVMKSLKER